jgi:hypothetical protein
MFGEMPEVGGSLTRNYPNMSTNNMLLHHQATKHLVLLHQTQADCCLFEDKQPMKIELL